MATYNGTAGNDTLNGSAGADTLVGKAGDDLYIVNNLGDVIVENILGGTDTIRTSVLDALHTYSLGAWANVENLSYTGTLAAQLKGNALDNVIRANSATSVNDTLYGGAGNDALSGYSGNDSLMGGSGNDTLDGGVGTDMMIGGSGNDTYIVAQSTDRVFEYVNGGFDTIQSATLKDLRLAWTHQVEGLTYNGTTAATLYGNDLGNALTSTSATADTLLGGLGNDTLNGGAGTDSLVGGLGDDLYFVASADIVKELVDQGNDTFVGGKTDISIAAYATTIENLVYTGATGASLVGNGLDNGMVGGAGKDTINGGLGNDSLAGGAGADSVLGGNGNDFLYGGGVAGYSPTSGFVPDTAKDTLVGGAGNDHYMIDNDQDLVVESSTGGTLDVVVSSIDNSLARYANVEALVLQQGSDAWYGEGSTRNDIIVGNQGDNYLVGGAGNDTLSGTSTDYNYGYVSDALEGGAGNDALVAFGFGNGTYYNNEVSLFGGEGSDLYVLGSGYYLDNDRYGGVDTGLSGVDTAVLFSSGSIENIEGVEVVQLYGAGGAADTAALAAINKIYGATHDGDPYAGSLGSALDATGNSANNRVLGNDLANHLYGLAGNDTMSGGLGNDTLDGGAGNDSLVGGAGDDWYYVTTGDTVVEAADQGFDILSSATLLNLGSYANVDGFQYTGTASVSLNRGVDNITNDYFGGGAGNDTITGYGGADTLYGGAGNDAIDGGVGVDQLHGEIGNDTLLGGADGDSLYGDEGADNLQGGAATDQLFGGVGNDTLDGGTEDDTLYGGAGSDSLLGGTGNDTLYSGDNYYQPDSVSNTMRGGEGNDYLYGGSAADALFGDAGDDNITGNGGNDTLSGGDGNDDLFGGDGNDLVSGGTVTKTGSAYYSYGGDVLWGDNNFGSGAPGADIFRFDAATAANAAVETFTGSGQFYFNTGTLVADFNATNDLLRFAASTVGDNDTSLENVQVKDAAGGTFDVTAEMVIVRADVAGTFSNGNNSVYYFDAAGVISALGSADSAFSVGSERLFVVDNGSSSAILQFVSANADAVVTADELYLVAVVNGNTTLGSSDFTLA